LLNIKRIKSTIERNLLQFHGWRTNRKIVIFESDDWGAMRTPTKIALTSLEKHGIEISRCHYMMYDSLADEDDLNYLFELLAKHRDHTNNHPVITANSLTANPDFEKIRSGNYKKYYYEHFTETLKRYPKHANSFAIWKQGIEVGVFHPQSHGREHLNISKWMHDLQNANKETRLAFDLGIFGLSAHITKVKRGSYLAAYDGAGEELKYDRKIIIDEALKQFKETFGYPSLSFIAPNYIWDEEVENCLQNGGVKYIQGSRTQRISRRINDPLQVKRHYLGEKNNVGQHYLVRNAYFEPSSQPDKDWVNYCLNEIKTAFRYRKPAIIGTHRVNYIGHIDPENRDRNLKLLDHLITAIQKKWPDVEFLSSDKLGEIISNQQN